MTASEKLRALDGDDFEVSWRLRNVLPLIADVVEAAEQTRASMTNQRITADSKDEHDTAFAAIISLGSALTALRKALEGGDE